jgi:hypothetical protein
MSFCLEKKKKKEHFTLYLKSKEQSNIFGRERDIINSELIKLVSTL